jgi:hypothetical protein
VTQNFLGYIEGILPDASEGNACQLMTNERYRCISPVFGSEGQWKGHEIIEKYRFDEWLRIGKEMGRQGGARSKTQQWESFSTRRCIGIIRRLPNLFRSASLGEWLVRGRRRSRGLLDSLSTGQKPASGPAAG